MAIILIWKPMILMTNINVIVLLLNIEENQTNVWTNETDRPMWTIVY